MASGKQHFKRANQILFVGAGVAFFTQPILLTAATVIGLAIGKYANPDVRDQEHIKNHAEHRFAASFGSIAGFLWSLYWWPLAKIVPHRNWASHLAGPATLLAYLYLFVPPLLFVWWHWYASEPLMIWMQGLLFSRFALQVLLGWFIQDLIHLYQDGFVFYWKGGIK